MSKLALFKCTVVEPLKPRFMQNNQQFLHLLRKGALVFDFGFDEALAKTASGAAGSAKGGALLSSPATGTEQPLTSYLMHLSHSRLLLPDMPARECHAAMDKLKRKWDSGASSNDPCAKKPVHYHASETTRDVKGCLDHAPAADSGSEKEEDLLGAMQQLQRGSGDDSEEDSHVTLQESLSKLRGYQKLCERKAREVEKLQQTIQRMAAEAEANKSEAQGLKDKAVRFR